MTPDKTLLLGQRLAVGFDGYTIPREYADLIRRYKIGNVILFRRNVKDYEQLKKLCADLRSLIIAETGYEPFIMIDEECGSVSRLAHIAAPTPSALAIGATDDPENAYKIGRIVGEELRSVGINFNLAPDLDCLTNPESSVIGNRSFATEPEKAAAFGLRYTKGLQDAGVLACGKHFPGHGDTAQDSHLDLPIVDKPREAVLNTELVPFAAAIAGGIDAIMSAHVVFPAFEPERVPSTVSRRVMTGLLRDTLGFKGLIVSDGMEMNAVMNLFGIEEAVRRALAAGVDIALVCHSAAQAASCSEYIAKALDEGTLDAAETEAHFAHIVARKATLLPAEGGVEQFGGEAQKAVARAVMDEAVKVLHAPNGQPLPTIDANTLFLGVPARATTLANDDVPLDAASIATKAFSARHAALDTTERADTAVLFAARHPDLPALIDAAHRLDAAGTKVIAVAMNTPRCLNGLPDTVWQVSAWQYDAFSTDAVIRMLKK